jgi:hypothetical protein
MRKPVWAAIALLAGVAPATAAPYDGSAVMKCRIQNVMSCREGMICVQGTAATAMLPPVLTVDVPNKRITGDGAGRVVKIVSVGKGPGRLVLHGEEIEMSGTAWNVIVEEKAGGLRGAVLTHTGGYLVFGSCAAG